MFSDLNEKQLKELKHYILTFKNKYRKTIDVPGNLKFGCEVEFNTYKNLSYYRANIDSNFKIKKDGSAYNIVEAISPIMHNTEEDWLLLKNTLKKLNRKGARIEDTSGGHIHYDASIVNDDNIICLIKFWYVFEDIIYEFGSGEFDHLREAAIYYAKKFIDIESDIKKYEEDYNLNNFYKFGKYRGLNLSNHLCNEKIYLRNQDTYEVRVPNGSLNINTWQNNVEFFGNFMKFANNSANKEFIDELYKNGKLDTSFENKLLLAELLYKDETSKVRFLNQFTLHKALPKENLLKSYIALHIM